MIKPYTAVGLIPTVRGIRTRADIKRNLEHLSHLVKAASWLSSLDLPVRCHPECCVKEYSKQGGKNARDPHDRGERTGCYQSSPEKAVRIGKKLSCVAAV